jgi:hypothetical protein
VSSQSCEFSIANRNHRAGANSTNADASTSRAQPESKQFMAFRNLLSVDPKNLDSDAELRRFFGSKVVSMPPYLAHGLSV